MDVDEYIFNNLHSFRKLKKILKILYNSNVPPNKLISSPKINSTI